jgi:predicted aspartyl protease
MDIRDNRAFVSLRLLGPNGRSKAARFWLDSGGDTVFLSGPLAHELGLQESGAAFTGMGNTPSHFVTKPRLSIGGMEIDLARVGVAASLSESSRNAFAGVEAEGFLPATVLRNYDVVFNYPAHSFSLFQPGTAIHRGTPVPMLVKAQTGFARIEIAIDGKPYGFMLDTGAAYTGVSRAVMDQWIARHPSWRHSIGAVGTANMVGKQFDVTNQLLRIPEIRWGPFKLQNVGMVSRPSGVYEKIVSEDMAAPIIGALSGNVLRQFRLDLDYPDGVAYLSFEGADSSFDLDCVGLILQVNASGKAVVSGVAQHDGHPEINGLESGDILLKVDSRAVTGSPLATILQRLSGTIGTVKHLTIQRGDQVLTISAAVTAHP